MKKISIVQAVILSGFILIPLSASAQAGAQISQGITSFAGLIDLFTGTIIKSLATLAMSVAMLVFFYGIVKYIWGRQKGDSAEVTKGNQFMTWGLVALFVMFSVYGIIKFGQNILFGNGADMTSITIPNIQINKAGSGNVLPSYTSSPGAPLQGTPTVGSTPGSVNTNSDNDVCRYFQNGSPCSLGKCFGGVCVTQTDYNNYTQTAPTQNNTVADPKTVCENSGKVWMNGTCETKSTYSAVCNNVQDESTCISEGCSWIGVTCISK